MEVTSAVKPLYPPYPPRHLALETWNQARRNSGIDPARSYITKLPNELLVEVAGLLESQPLFRLCRVSKRFDKIARKHIYGTISFHGRCGEWIARFLNTMKKWPHLAEMVHSLRIFPMVRDSHQHTDGHFGPITEGSNAAKPDEARMVGQLLCLLPGLRRLRIGVYKDLAYPPFPFVDNPLQRLFGKPGDMEDFNLSSVAGLRNLDILIFEGIELHWPWLTLPLRKLILFGNGFKGAGGIRVPTTEPPQHLIQAGMEILPSLESLTSLEIACRSTILAQPPAGEYEFFSKILKHCKRLRKLTIVLTSGSKDNKLGLNVNRQGSMDALLDGFPSSYLFTLDCLNFFIHERDEYAYLEFLEPTTRLNQFTQLTELQIPQDALFGKHYKNGSSTPVIPLIQLIPPNLRKLSIMGPRMKILAPILEDFVQAKTQFPHLKHLHFECVTGYGDSYEEAELTLKALPIWKELLAAYSKITIRLDEESYKIGNWKDPDYDLMAFILYEFLKSL